MADAFDEGIFQRRVDLALERVRLDCFIAIKLARFSYF